MLFHGIVVVGVEVLAWVVGNVALSVVVGNWIVRGLKLRIGGREEVRLC